MSIEKYKNQYKKYVNFIKKNIEKLQMPLLEVK